MRAGWACRHFRPGWLAGFSSWPVCRLNLLVCRFNGTKDNQHTLFERHRLLPTLRKPTKYKTCTISNVTIVALPLPHPTNQTGFQPRAGRPGRPGILTGLLGNTGWRYGISPRLKHLMPEFITVYPRLNEANLVMLPPCLS
jgi:hypothetical protein